MKEFSNILVALGVTLFLLTVGMKSDLLSKHCKSPYQTIIDTITVDGCQYEVDLCVFCGVAYPGEVIINSVRNIGSCAPTLTQDQIISQIYSQLSTHAYLWFQYCQFNVPPCSGKARKKIEWKVYTCWKMILVHNDPDPDNRIYLSIPCGDDTYCKVTYSYCVDPFGIVQSNVSSYLGVNWPITCTLEGYEIIKPITYVGEESECYIVHTPCNP